MEEDSGPQATILAIESFVYCWLEIVVDEEGGMPSFEVPKRTKENVILTTDEFMGHQQLVHQESKVMKKLNRQGARSYTNILQVLEFAYRLLQEGRRATLREVYYSFKSGDPFLAFKTQAECDHAISDVAGLLGVARHDLNIFGSAKGLIAGRVSFMEPETGVEVDCQATGQGVLIESYWLTHPVEFTSCTAQIVLVVEKDTIFNRLVECRFWERYPCIIVTGKGVPDICTRAAVAQLWRILELEVVALTDCNPFGLALLLTYKIGSIREATSSHFTVDVKWLGFRPSQLQSLNLPAKTLQRQSAVDQNKCQSLINSVFMKANPLYREEVELFVATGTKCELEALHSVSLTFLLDFVENALLNRDYF